MFALAGVVFISITCEKPDEVDSINAYFIGNSITRNIPLEKLQKLFDYQGIEYSYGTQPGEGHQLDRHLSKRNHGNKPVKENTTRLIHTENTIMHLRTIHLMLSFSNHITANWTKLKDKELINAIQQIVWEVVISNPLTGVRN
jgi:hypothetical protein